MKMRRINPYPPAAASEIERCIEIGQRVREQARQRAAARLVEGTRPLLAQEYLQRKPQPSGPSIIYAAPRPLTQSTAG
jgi:hypothetical protein